MVQRKYFNANFPYDDRVTGFWSELITEYLHAFVEFLEPDHRTVAVNDMRGIVLKTFDHILTPTQRIEDSINLQCVIFPLFARIDIRFHQAVKESLDTYQIESKRGYQIEGLTFESRETPIPYVYRLELKQHPATKPAHDQTKS